MGGVRTLGYRRMKMVNLKKEISENIEAFNKNQTKYIESLQKKFPNTQVKYEIKKILDENVKKFTSSSAKLKKALKMLKNLNYQKNKVDDIANFFVIRKADMEKILTREIFKDLEANLKTEIFRDLISDEIEKNYFDKTKGLNFIKNNLNKNLEQFLPYVFRDGFDQDFAGLEVGTNASNEGDGAEHLFVAKAMIAGFNCSVVDIGSSKYDVVIEDKNGDLLKVQVKSFGKNGVFSRKGRDRGGQGIDSSNPSNKGSLVTSKNCDIFAAVNKSNGEIFIFSKNEIDKLPVNIKRANVLDNWENWSKINHLVE